MYRYTDTHTQASRPAHTHRYTDTNTGKQAEYRYPDTQTHTLTYRYTHTHTLTYRYTDTYTGTQ